MVRGRTNGAAAVPARRDRGGRVLDVAGLTITYAGAPAAISRLDLHVDAGEAVGVIGESGCGKSTLALAALGLLPADAKVEAARFDVCGTDVRTATERELRRMRGGQAAMVFQDPVGSLDPCMTIGRQVREAVRLAQPGLSRRAARTRSVQLLRQVGIADAADRLDQFPHEFSGGMCQRVMLAIAMAGNPELLVADEPTTALDVTVQKEVLATIDRLRSEHGLALLFISHDLALVSQVCDRLVVMYAGEIVEAGPAAELLARPSHPYTRALLDATPLPGERHETVLDLPNIPGQVSEEDRARPGCRFRPRCPVAEPVCEQPQPLLAAGGARSLRCGPAFREAGRTIDAR